MCIYVRPIAATFGGLLAGGHLAVALAACSGCGAGPTPQTLDVASYVAGVEKCVAEHPDPDDCEGVLECRNKVQAAHGVVPSGSCEPRDAGADGGAL